MLRLIIAAAAIFAVLRCPAEGSDRQFVARSPNGKFEVILDQTTMPPLIIREVGTKHPLMSMDEERFCGRGAEASWSPDSTKVVILVHCRLADVMRVCRLRTDSVAYFVRTEGPGLPEDTVKFEAWPNETT